MTATEVPAFRAALLGWFDVEARALPWRGETDPYRILVSEVMLQQTQVATVVGYYERFLAACPSLADLAATPLDEVLRLWQGLGYYHRARRLHALAHQVVATRDGCLPTEPGALRHLPGIGDYTAGAVASIAFGRRCPAVDGNVTRVLSRLFALPGDPRAVARRHAAELVDAARPGDHNQALMELGATVCTPRPACAVCPVQRFCAALASGEPTRWPEAPPRKPPRERLHVAAVVRRAGRLLLGQRPAEGRWAGLWELPRVELAPTDDAAEGLRMGLLANLGVTSRVGPALAELHHAVSGERIRLVAHECELTGSPRPLGYVALCWADGETGHLALATPQRRLLRLLVALGAP